MNTECANLLSFLSGELGEKEKKGIHGTLNALL